ncbi:MAG: hypothetical protein AAF483_10775 [Planctomycetota bacterium]
MEIAEYWRTLFANWPDNIERRGMVLSKQGEVVSFENFLVSPGLLLLERSAPDASGARKAFIGYDSIALVKMPTTADLDDFLTMGFQHARPRKPNS